MSYLKDVAIVIVALIVYDMVVKSLLTKKTTTV